MHIIITRTNNKTIEEIKFIKHKVVNQINGFFFLFFLECIYSVDWNLNPLVVLTNFCHLRRLWNIHNTSIIYLFFQYFFFFFISFYLVLISFSPTNLFLNRVSVNFFSCCCCFLNKMKEFALFLYILLLTL